jgi:hypothetical protein
MPAFLSRRALRAGASGTARKARWPVSAGSTWIEPRIAGSRMVSSDRNDRALNFAARACSDSGAEGCGL